ncbi:MULTISPECIES: amidohydrolase [unclassified Streptomyces]|uniref:amidohydrolase n=1 Tax=unclassified Streptomyces TaxID=2593676 RepID=UPI000C27C13A|nr:amidohydrolase [Streptomyces sp. CB01373]PJM92148.1 hydrolase [Streptomyces sp. CB01373]
MHHPLDAPDRTLLVTGAAVAAAGTATRAEALAVRGDRIVHVGTADDARAALGRVDRELKLDGGLVHPGFVDAHCHPVMYGQALAWVDCRPERVPDIDTLVDVLREAARTLPAGVPVRGFGYEHRRLAERRHPSRHDLDRVADDREVYVMNASGHGGVVNSHTLRTCGITAGTPDPEGGSIGRFDSGEPDGQLWDAACDLLTGPGGVKIGNHGPNFHLTEPDAVMADHLARAQEVFLAAGVTTVGDAQASRREMETYLRAQESGSLRMRVSAYLTSALLDTALELGVVHGFGGDLFRVQGVKFYADGTLGGWTAYFPEGYAADCCHHGQLYHSVEEYAEIVARAHRAGLQTATHAQSPYAIGMVLDAVEKAQADRPRPDMRHRIEHSGLPTDEQIERMGALGVVPVMQPQHHLRTGDGTLTAVGELGHRYNPAGRCLTAGVPVVFSSDAPVAPPAPLEAVSAAATRRTVLGTVLGDETLRMPVADGLHAHTAAAARALHREHAVGSLAPGMLADFVVLDADPLQTAAGELAGIGVRETWIGGTRAWAAPGR